MTDSMDRPAVGRRAESGEPWMHSPIPYPSDTPLSLADAALHYVQRGLSVIPVFGIVDGKCTCGGRPKCTPGKHPITDHGLKDASADPRLVEHWWVANPDANLGIVLPPSGLVILDVDPRNGGAEQLAAYEGDHGPLPWTVTTETGGGGQHYWFRSPGVLKPSKALGPGLDLLGAGSYAMASPSHHASGGTYRWKEGCDQLAELPVWITEKVQKHGKKAPGHENDRGTVKTASTKKPVPDADAPLTAEGFAGVPEGQRDEVMFKFICGLRGSGCSREEAEAKVRTFHAEFAEGSHPFTIDDALLKVDDVWERYDPNEPDDGGSKKETTASRLIALTLAHCTLFHNRDDDAFANMEIDLHRETHRLRSRNFKHWLRAEYYRAFSASPNSQGLEDALSTLEALAQFEGPEHEVSLRSAELDGNIYIDLGDAEWRAVKVTQVGWEMEDRPPVFFHRPQGYQALANPQRGGDLQGLKLLVNIDDADLVLLLVCMIAMMRPGRPCPILALNGEQGSAKSTLCRVIRALVDPNDLPNRRPPRNSEDLFVGARHSRLLVFDNMSGIKDWLSDDLCSLVTGTGMAVRQLYTNFDEATFRTMCPVVLNGIDELGTRGDFLDRVIPITLPTIPDERRVTEREFEAQLEAALPRLTGALFQALSVALSRLDEFCLDAPGRMADFYELAVAAAPGIGFSEEEVLTALARVRSRTTESVLEGSVLVDPLRDLLEDAKGHRFVGNASSLLSKLADYVDKEDPLPKGWPSGARALSNELRRLAPDLRRSKIEVEQIASGRKWKITLRDVID